MLMILTSVKTRMFSALVFAALTTFVSVHSVRAAALPVGPELAKWSDMAFASGINGGYTANTLSFTVTAGNSNDLELDIAYGPIGGGRHYGSGGTAGGAFAATLSVSGVQIDEDPNEPARAIVVNGGSVTITLVNSVAGSIGTDYGIANGTALLTGYVTEALLDANGNDTLDVLFTITGGALQTGTNSDPNLTGVQFADGGSGLLRFTKSGLPSAFTSDFSLTGGTLNVLGIPEPGTTVLALLGALLTLTSRVKQEN